MPSISITLSTAHTARLQGAFVEVASKLASAPITDVDIT